MTTPQESAAATSSGAAGSGTTTAQAPAKKATKRAAAKKAAGSSATKATKATKSTARKSTASKATATKTTATKSPAKKSPAKKAAAQSPAKKAATRSPAKKQQSASQQPNQQPNQQPTEQKPPQQSAGASGPDRDGVIGRVMEWRTEAAKTPTDPDERFLGLTLPVWDVLSKVYFRVETDGWEKIPDRTSLLIGVHSGGTLTMDAWTLVHAWQRHFGTERVLHGTAHDVLLTLPGLGDYFRASGVISASRESVGRALGEGRDVIVWPGGEKDAMRSWRRRDEAELGGRKGFVRQAIRSGVPILPVATVGGHDTVFILSEGKWLANALDRFTGLKKTLRAANLPIVAGLPFPLALEVLPAHIPLPAKIRTEFLDPIEVDDDPERVNDEAYVQGIYDEVRGAIQAGMTRLAKKRRFPVFG
ncbi:MAG: hypothetical protein QOJ32_3370 [Frankiaceae bacterium]|nr:hypothetical protein [Frankiaceae bacterium]